MAFHFMASLSLILHLLYHPMQGGGGFKKDSTSGFLFSYWDTKYKFLIF